MSFVKYILSKKPSIKKNLRMAGMKDNPEEFVKKSLKNATIMGFAVLIGLFFIMNKQEPSLVKPILGGIVTGIVLFQINLNKVKVAVMKAGKKIDRDVLFAGRFLLVKLNSGKPLINAIDEASHGFGDATKYFQKIMRDLELGTSLEAALDKATEYCPSNSLRKILFQITNALKIGVDVTHFLGAVLDEISDEQMTEILKYGKKLSSLTMFYMLGAIIVPSLGMTLFVVVAPMVGVDLNAAAFVVIILGLAIIQFIFITLFRSARPNVDL